MLSLDGVEAFYGRAKVLHGVSLVMGEGGALCLLGRNGAGKTTTLRTIMGLVRPAAGTIRFAGREIGGLAPYRAARRGLGYVPEDRRIFTDLTVAENLLVGTRPPRPGLAPWTEERVFALFPALAAMRARPAGRMSGGEQQMLAIARTLMGNPTLLLLDEPSEGLAPVVLAEVAAAICTIRADGVAVLLAEQNLAFAAGMADRAAVIETGRIVWAGEMAALRASAALRERYLAA